MKTKMLLFSIALILLAGLVAGGATMALFTDTEQATASGIRAGTIDIVPGGSELVPMNFTNIAPGFNTLPPNPYYVWTVRNNGTLPGRLSVTFSAIRNEENGVVEPEEAAEATTPGASAAGELGQYLVTGVHPEKIVALASPHITLIQRNDEEGWYIARVAEQIDTRGTIGWGPVGWSVPSRLFGMWQSGPPHPWGTPGLNHFGGRTFGTLGHLPNDILQPGQSVSFFVRAALETDLRRWDGTRWQQVDDNIIQSDSVHFDLTFTLTSVPPQTP